MSDPAARAELLDELPLMRLLPEEPRDALRRRFDHVSYGFGENILREGEDPDGFYVIASGRARMVRTGSTGEEIALRALRSGDTFGYLGPSGRRTRQATVRASGDVQVLRIGRRALDELSAQHPEIGRLLALESRRREVAELFRVHPALAALPPAGMDMLLSGLVEVNVLAGSWITRQGDQRGALFVVLEGKLRVFKEQDGVRRPVAYLNRGDFFGEMSVFQQELRGTSVQALAPCRLLSLSPELYDGIVRAHPALDAEIKTRLLQKNFRHIARVPADFGEENLPADAESQARAAPERTATGFDDGADEASSRAALPPFAVDGLFVKRERIRKFPFVRQIDEMDCGAACLAMVTRHFGRAVSLTRIRQVIHVASDGTSLKGLCQGAEELGLAARSVRASRRNLDDMPLPAIVLWEHAHWVVVYDVSSESVDVADPAVGLRRLPRKTFMDGWNGYAALFDYTTELERTPEDEATFGWVWPFFRPYLGLLARVASLALVVSALSMALPVITQVIVDRVLVDRDVGLLGTLMLAMGTVIVFMALATAVSRYLLAFVAVRLDAAMLDALTRRMLSLPMSYFQTRRTGDIQRRLAGMGGVRAFVVDNAVYVLTAVTQLAASIFLMLAYSRMLGAVFLAVLPVYALFMRYSSRRLRPLFAELEEALGRYNAHQVDTIRGIETVKAMGAEGRLRELMLAQFLGLAEKLFRANFTLMAYDGAVSMVSVVISTAFLWAGAVEVLGGRLSIGGLVAFNALVAMANGPLLLLLNRWDNLQTVTVLLDRMQDILGHEPEQGADHSRLAPVRALHGRVELEGLGFRYGGQESARILENVSFEAAPGKTIAIVGRSGSGKTTLVKCLAGLLEPTEGSIRFDGVDLKALSWRDLRRKIGFVLQENYLFDASIAANIAFSDDEPDMDRVITAARIANAHEFIGRLPLGYDTRIGESGLALSGGQRQRIAIARAVYPRPPILIFDEATSSLDTESERAVRENMAELLEGRTAFVIAHRLSTIREADMILVLEKGRIVEHGSHAELMAREGLYYYLVSQQLEA